MRLHGWFVPAGSERRATVLYLHGKGENVSSQWRDLEILHEAGFDALRLDYRGYGQSEGAPTEQGTFASTPGAVERLQEFLAESGVVAPGAEGTPAHVRP